MPYKHENTNKTIVQSYHAYSGDRAEAMLEIEEVYKKAKTLNELKNFTTERLKEREYTDEYDFGERCMCREIEEIIGGQINDTTKRTYPSNRC